MIWFHRHLNWTLLLAGVAYSILTFLSVDLAFSDSPSLAWNYLGLALIVIAFILIIGIEIWWLKQKHRSQLFLLLNLVPVVGFLVLISLENKSVT